MDPGTFNHSRAPITELLVANEFHNRYRGCILVGEDGDFVVNSLYIETGGQPRFIAKGANVADNFVLHKIRQLVIELSAAADGATQVRVQTAAFVQAVLTLIRDDCRLGLPPRKDEPRLDYLDALVEQRVEHFRELEHA